MKRKLMLTEKDDDGWMRVVGHEVIEDGSVVNRVLYDDPTPSPPDEVDWEAIKDWAGDDPTVLPTIIARALLELRGTLEEMQGKLSRAVGDKTCITIDLEPGQAAELVNLIERHIEE